MPIERSSAIRLDRVTVEYGALRALDGVSFDVPVGSVTGLVGRNGAGKTTAIRCLAGLLEPTAAESDLRILGLSPTRDRAAMVARTGFLLSDPALFSYLTPRETLVFLARAFGIPEPLREARALDLIRFFDLTDAADRLADNFSTGMKKRLSLAAALVHAPDVLILDEPFESLDPLMVRSLKKLLADFARAGRTVLLSSHLLDAVEEVCDRVVILEQGRVVASGSSAEVKSTIVARLPTATLEDLYASLMPVSDLPPMEWLTGGEPDVVRKESGRDDLEG